MDRTRRQELFWLLLIGGCIALFVAHHERAQRVSDPYDRSGLAALMRESVSAPVQRRDDDIVTGSIAAPAKPVARPSSSLGRYYYVSLGSYGSIDQATRRYLDVAGRDPSLEQGNKLRIETVSVKGDGTFHRVRMGNFASAEEARQACARARIAGAECPVIAVR